MVKLYKNCIKKPNKIFKLKNFIGGITIIFLLAQIQTMILAEEKHKITIEEMEVSFYTTLPLNLCNYKLDLYNFPDNPNVYPYYREGIYLDEDALKELFKYLEKKEEDFYSLKYIEEDNAEDKIIIKLRDEYTNLEYIPSYCESLEIIYNGIFLKEIFKYKPFSFEIDEDTDLTHSLLKGWQYNIYSSSIVANIITDFISANYCRIGDEPCSDFRMTYIINEEYPIGIERTFEDIYIPKIYVDEDQILFENKEVLVHIFEKLDCVPKGVYVSSNSLLFFIESRFHGREVTIFNRVESLTEGVEYKTKVMSQCHEIVTFVRYANKKIKIMNEDYLKLIESIDEINSKKFQKYFDFILNYSLFLDEFEEKACIYEQATEELQCYPLSLEGEIKRERGELEILEKKHMAYLSVKESSVAEGAYNYAKYALIIALFSFFITILHLLLPTLKLKK